MKNSGPSEDNPVYELVKTAEVDIRLGDEDAWTSRIEIFRDTTKPGRFRCRVWELELFRLTPSFPRDERDQPLRVTDDTIMVERGMPRSEIASMLNQPFEAASAEAALEMVLDDLRKFLGHATGGKAN